jgi:hypothetical protein
MTSVQCESAWTVWVDGDNERNDAFTHAFKEIHPEHESYMDRLSFDSDDEGDREHIACQCETVEDVQWMLTAARATGNKYGVTATLKECGREEYEAAVVVRVSANTTGMQSAAMVKSGAEADGLQKRIRGAISVLQGGKP